MSKEEIKEYLKRVDELEAKLTGEDKETLRWLIFGYNQCAKLLNETQKENKKLKAEYGTKSQVERDLLKEENKKLKENWIKLKEYINFEIPEDVFIDNEWFVSILDKMEELEGSDSNE